jgi:hypothetical protein
MNLQPLEFEHPDRTFFHTGETMISGVPANKLFRKLGGPAGARALLEGNLTIDFRRNRHNHIVFTIRRRNYTGLTEFERLGNAGFRVSYNVKWCLLSQRADSYDNTQRLGKGKPYKVTLVPTAECSTRASLAPEDICKRIMAKYKYQRPRAGIGPRLREVVSNLMLKMAGINYIDIPHDLIQDSYTDPGVIRIGTGYLDVELVKLGQWRSPGALAFIDPGN